MSDDIVRAVFATWMAVVCLGVAFGIFLGLVLMKLDAAAEEIKPEPEQALWWRKAKLKAMRDR